MKIIYQKLALTGVLAALLLSAGCGGAILEKGKKAAGEQRRLLQMKQQGMCRLWLSRKRTVKQIWNCLRHWK